MAFTSAAQSFVVELLSNIFLECLPEDDLARMQRKEAPLNVSHVCRHWRYVSFSTPRLWASLSLDGTRDRAVQILQTFLRRSGSIDFHFKFDCVGKYLEPGDTILEYYPDYWWLVEPILYEVSSQYERIKSVTLRIPVTIAHCAMEYAIDKLPTLEHLSFQVFQVYGRLFNPYLDLDRSFWEIASSLVSLELTGAHQFVLDISSLVLCPDLKYLALNGLFTIQKVIRIIDFCPALESLYIDLDGPPARAISPQTNYVERTVLPTIRSLEMRVEDPGAHAMIRDVFRFFQLPNLTRLVMDWRTSQETKLETFLLASHPPLEELSLTTADDDEFKEGPITRILKLLPGLRKLRIRHQRTIIQELTLSESGDIGSCPLLEELTLEIKGTFKSCDEAIQTLWKATEDMVSCRWNSTKSENSESTTCSLTARNARSLRKMTFPGIYVKDWETGQLYSGIRNFQREGLNVSFRDETRVSTKLWM